jgi:hypothetical protein
MISEQQQQKQQQRFVLLKSKKAKTTKISAYTMEYIFSGILLTVKR